MTSTTAPPAVPSTALPAAARMLDALSRRDFAALGRALSRTVTFRALVPRGPIELAGAAEVAAQFDRWFGDGDSFEVVDASIGPLGAKTCSRWRVRMCSPDGTARIAEQYAVASGAELLESIDLLCSGFQLERNVR